MWQRRSLTLSDEQRDELSTIVKGHEKAYLRERVAALLKISQGATAHAVARKGLLLGRDPDTVYAWLDRYQAEGVKGLVNRPGRGRKPAFSPSAAG